MSNFMGRFGEIFSMLMSPLWNHAERMEKVSRLLIRCFVVMPAAVMSQPWSVQTVAGPLLPPSWPLSRIHPDILSGRRRSSSYV